MNPALKHVYEETLTLFQEDPRVLAGFMGGSVGTPREDDYSDVDPAFLIAEDAFDVFDADLASLFSQVGAEPILKWPERCNGPKWRNYALFFHAGDDLVQYDITIEALPEDGCKAVDANRILFDKAGVLDPVQEATDPVDFKELLVWRIEMYWIYVYILKKYLLRGDPFRILAAQRELFDAHLVILHALKPGLPLDWWPVLAAGVGGDTARQALLSYFNDGSPGEVRRRLPAQLARFSQDARTACAEWNLTYPESFEHAVREAIEPLPR